MEWFVYGTLTDADRAAAVLDEFEYRGPAILEGWRRVDGVYPTLVPGGETEGRLLATGEAAALDAYEGGDDGPYVRVAVPRTDGGEAWVYVGDPARLDAPGRWPGDGPFRERVDREIRDRDVVIRPR